MIRYDNLKNHETLSDAALQKVCKETSTTVSAGCLGHGQGFRVHKFTMSRQLTLIAYRVEKDSLVLYQVGPHENFYKNLKSYLKEIGG